MKSDVSFYFKQRVVLKKWRVVSLQTTCRLLVVKHLGWSRKRGGEVLAVTLVTAKKVKSCGMRARVREGKTPTHCFVFDRAERRFSACILQGQQNYQTLSFWRRFVNYAFQNWGCLQRKLHFFVICSLFGAISLHILIGRCFETW